MEMLRDIIPGLRSIAMLWNPADRDHPDTLKGAQQAAKLLNIEIVPVSAKGSDEFARAFADMTQAKVDGRLCSGIQCFAPIDK
jgi:ABC-type uncharacterized transport system substrate-binding protein